MPFQPVLPPWRLKDFSTTAMIIFRKSPPHKWNYVTALACDMTRVLSIQLSHTVGPLYLVGWVYRKGITVYLTRLAKMSNR